MERGLFCLCPTWSVVLINQIFFHKRQSLFCFGFRRNPPSDALLITHYCTLVGDSCRDSGRIWQRETKIHQRQAWHNLAHFDSFWGSAAFRCWKVQRRRRISWKRTSKIWPLLARVRPLFQPLSVGIAEHSLAFVFMPLMAAWFPMLVNGWDSWAIFRIWNLNVCDLLTEGETHPDDAEQRTRKGCVCQRKDWTDAWWQAELWFVGNLS